MTEPLTADEMKAIAGIDKNCRLIKGQVFLWQGAKDWEDLWDEAARSPAHERARFVSSMTPRYILTVDVGTSSTKTALWDDSGAKPGRGVPGVPAESSRPLWAEIDGRVWWEAVCATIRQVYRQRHRSAPSCRGRRGWRWLDAAARWIDAASRLPRQ